MVYKSKTKAGSDDKAGQLKELFNVPNSKSTAQQKCEAQGGTWDGVSCILPPKQPTPEMAAAGQLVPTANTDKFGRSPSDVPTTATGKVNEGSMISKEGRDYIVNPTDLASIRAKEAQHPLGEGEQGTRFITSAQQEQQRQGALLAQQVGQIDPSTATATNLSQTEALTTGFVQAIPSALNKAVTYGGTLAALGAAGGSMAGPAGTAVGAGAGAVIGAAAGFVQGISSGMISNMKSQRTDNTNAQQRVLDEGKQTLNDWVTLAKADPANRAFYLAQFNNQLQLIQNAHVQMITDTNADIVKFETAIPNLAEFSSFYNTGGERDALINEMIGALQTPTNVDYSMLELTNRRVVQ